MSHKTRTCWVAEVGLAAPRLACSLLYFYRLGESEDKIPSHVAVAGRLTAVGSCVCVGPAMTLEIDSELASKMDEHWMILF